MLLNHMERTLAAFRPHRITQHGHLLPANAKVKTDEETIQRDSEVQNRFRYAGNVLRDWSEEGAIFSSSSLDFIHNFVLFRLSAALL
jgi:hypothetical protein